MQSALSPAKDTLSNIEETGESVVNIVSLYLSNIMFESSKNHPPEADEFEKACLTPAPREVVGSPRVEEADVSMKCLLDWVLPLGTDHLIIGRMVRFHVRDELEGRTVFESGGCGKNPPLRIVARKLRLLRALGLFTS